VEPTERLKEAVAQMIGESGLSFDEFARKAEVNRATLRRILDGDVERPQRATLSKISQASGRPWDALQRVLDLGEDLPERRGEGDLGRLVEILERQQRQLDRLEDRIRTLEDADGPR
jgi:transcriptional regulator with XRE-family HTH domain